MRVREALLAILAQGPCYGYQLRTEYARRTGGTRLLNVGQVYHTLERLERDGLVDRDDPDELGHVFWALTDLGADAARAGLLAPSDPADRSALPVKIALAASLPGVDLDEIVDAERTAVAERIAGLRADLAAEPADAALATVAGGLLAGAEADAHWLDETARLLGAVPPHLRAVPLSDERPRRGRPPRADAAA
ncbi:PadR family transcriptional regulator [Microbacterium gilvum]|uniref:Helix-turn-helix transcriptional regulator n=1 Tax=Microbacterium gilvum TaxID=1336204 RepID=A0ABP8ZY08_9MICO